MSSIPVFTVVKNMSNPRVARPVTTMKEGEEKTILQRREKVRL